MWAGLVWMGFGRVYARVQGVGSASHGFWGGGLFFGPIEWIGVSVGWVLRFGGLLGRFRGRLGGSFRVSFGGASCAMFFGPFSSSKTSCLEVDPQAHQCMDYHSAQEALGFASRTAVRSD